MTTGPASFPLQDLRADLRGRRAVVYGAVGDPGQAIVAALRAAGARVGLTSVTTDGAALFALKRAAAGAPAQAVDFANPASVRVATRKLAKALGGLDVAVVVPPPAAIPPDTTGVLRIAAREIARGEGGAVVCISAVPPGPVPDSLIAVDAPRAPAAEIAALTVHLATVPVPGSGPRLFTIRDVRAVPLDLPLESPRP